MSDHGCKKKSGLYRDLYIFQKGGSERWSTDQIETCLSGDKMQMAVSVEELDTAAEQLWTSVLYFWETAYRCIEKMLEKGLKVPYSFAPSYMNRQRAAVVGALGIQYYKAGRYETAAGA